MNCSMLDEVAQAEPHSPHFAAQTMSPMGLEHTATFNLLHIDIGNNNRKCFRVDHHYYHNLLYYKNYFSVNAFNYDLKNYHDYL